MVLVICVRSNISYTSFNYELVNVPDQSSTTSHVVVYLTILPCLKLVSAALGRTIIIGHNRLIILAHA